MALGCVGLFALILLAGCGGGNSEVQTPAPGVDVVSYNARIRLDPVTQYILGKVRLEVLHPDSLRTLELELHSVMLVERVSVNDERVRFRRDGSQLIVPLPSGDSTSVEVTYKGYVFDGVITAEGAGQAVTFSQSWPRRGAGWLVGVHHPSDPARFTLNLIVPNRYSVAASGQPAPTHPRSDSSWTRHTFTLQADAPTYTFAFAVADSFVVVEDETASGIEIRHHLLTSDAGRAALLDRTPAILDTLASMLGPYPYETYATVEVPMSYAGMENAAASFLSADLYRGLAGERNALEQVNVHEAAHQWFGNDVVPADWADLWLAEGFATYLTTVVYERMDGPEVAREQRARMAQLGRQDARRRLVPERYDDPEALLSATVYQKGGTVLHLLRLALGDEAFFSALRRLARDFADQPLSTDDLQMLLEEESGVDLDGIFSFWVHGTQIPTIHTEWDSANRRLSWRIDGDEGTLENLPVELLIRQQGRTLVARALEGELVLPGSDKPRVLPIGVLMDVRD